VEPVDEIGHLVALFRVELAGGDEADGDAVAFVRGRGASGGGETLHGRELPRDRLKGWIAGGLLREARRVLFGFGEHVEEVLSGSERERGHVRASR
jgi:hypothetical protein